MSRAHRIAAGGITFRDDEVLLVRYQDGGGRTFLVAPGGALKDGENVVQAIVRETEEETGVTVRPEAVVLLEDLESRDFKMLKVWMTCRLVAGEIRDTEGARKEGIVEVGWFRRERLLGERVYPELLVRCDWAEI